MPGIHARASETCPTCTTHPGLSATGLRPRTRRWASDESSEKPTPYTVSVGRITSRPAARRSAVRAAVSGPGCRILSRQAETGEEVGGGIELWTPEFVASRTLAAQTA